MTTSSKITRLLALAAPLLILAACSEQAPTGVDMPSPAFSEAADAVPTGGDDVSIATGGDNPLTTSFMYEGNVDLAIHVIPFSSVPVPSAFTVAGIPATATILQALMYVQRWNAPLTGATAVFDGTPLGPLAAFSVDPAGGFLLQAYRFDVTGLVPGNGAYPFTFSTSFGQNYYAALVVVYSDASLPAQTILINDGSEAIGTGSSSNTFADLVAGPGTLTTVTQADDLGGSNEAIYFNGVPIAGPDNIFNANLGSFASMHQLPVGVIDGDNTAAITTEGDLFGYHLSILEAPPLVIEVDIDIKPGSDPNSINPKSMGVVPVAILGSADFDVTDIDVTTLTFGPAGAAPAHDLTNPATYADHLQDVNLDGFMDLVSHYRQKETGLTAMDTEACIDGATTGGTPITGCDAVRVLDK